MNKKQVTSDIGVLLLAGMFGIGLLFSLAGDISLMFIDRFFIVGLVAFLLVHVAGWPARHGAFNVWINLPTFVDLKVIQADPGVKGDTATGATKPVTMETGYEIQVPLFIEQGETLRLDTRTGQYVSRVKE